MRRLLAVLLIACPGAVANATVIHVPADYPTIQQGLNAAVAGDEVRVAAGTYKENLSFGSAQDGVALISESGAAMTTLDGQSAGSVVVMVNVGSGTRIVGFTITGGGGGVLGGGIRMSHASPAIEHNTISGNVGNSAGAIYVDFSSPAIRDNVIEDNQAPGGSGGGIYVDHTTSNPVIEHNVIRRNRAGAYGGGITIWQGAAPLVKDNTITDNHAVLGAGVYITFNSTPTVEDNLIAENEAASGGGGMMIDVISAPTIRHNIIRDNRSTGGSGGGVYCDHSCTPNLVENVIARNFAGAYGGGVTAWESSTPRLEGNTIVLNESVLPGAGGYFTRQGVGTFLRTIVAFNKGDGIVVDASTLGGATFECGDVSNNSGANYLGVPDPTGTNGNISADPLFCDVNQLDVQLNATSPCAEANAPPGCGRIGARDVHCGLTIPVGFDFEPNTLNLQSLGRWVSGTITPGAPLTANDIEVSSILLNGVVAVDPDAPISISPDGTSLTVKFRRADVILAVPPGNEVTVTVTGTIAGNPFAGTDVIVVKTTNIHHPQQGDVLSPGSPITVDWDLLAPPAPTVAILASTDDGLTWDLVARDLPNTGSFDWTVPNWSTTTARLAVVQIETTDPRDPSGYTVIGALGVSGAFAITGTLPVPERAAQFALRPVGNPSTGGVRVSLSLPSPAPATLSAYDVTGRMVLSREIAGAGRHSVTLGERMPAGVYVVRLSQTGQNLAARVTVIR